MLRIPTSEYYAFGNPQPTFDPTTHDTDQPVGRGGRCRLRSSTANHYLFDQQTINVAPSNGFLKNLWWSNYESYSPNGNYSTCNYNWKLGYNITEQNVELWPGLLRPQRLPLRADVHQRLGVRQR